MLTFLASMFSFMIVFITLRVVVYFMATNNRLFTFRAQDQLKYLRRGELVIKIIYKLTDHYVDQKTGEVIYSVGAGNEQWSWCEIILGATWIGIAPNEILVYEVEYDRPPKPGETPESVAQRSTDKDRYSVDVVHGIVHRYTLTDLHFWKRVYPVAILGIELSDLVKVDIYGTMTIQTSNALRPVITLMGDWYGHVRDAVHGAVTDWARTMDIDQFKAASKAENQGSLERAILATAETSSGTKATTGTFVAAFNFREWRPTPGAPEVERALVAERVAKLNGLATVATAKAQAQAITLEGEAQAKAATLYVNAAGSNSVGAGVLKVRELSGAIRDHKGALALGQAGVILPLDDVSSGDTDTPPTPGANPQPGQSPSPTTPTQPVQPPQQPQQVVVRRHGHRRKP